MAKTILFVGVLLTPLQGLAAPLPLFDAHLRAMRDGDGVEITALIVNHSHHRACYSLDTPNVTLRYKDGEASVLVSTRETGWEGRLPAPAPIQVVPTDGKERSYPWATMPLGNSGTSSAEAVSVETTIELYDCRSFLDHHDGQLKNIFEEELTAPIEH